ncbi:hypothetical protein YC2023_004411 [Brassica napus]
MARADCLVSAGGRTGNGSFGIFPRASNSQLRTGTDKGNPTKFNQARVNGRSNYDSLKIPTVPVYYPAKPKPRERAWQNQRGKKTLLSLTLVRLCKMT